MSFIDDHAKELGIEPICRELAVAPSSYHEHASRRADPGRRSARARRDDEIGAQIRQVHEASFGLYGTRKVWHQLRRQEIKVAKCTVERLMRGLGLTGIRRGKTTITTVSNPKVLYPLDRVNREFRVSRPNALWVVDFTYVHTWTGFVYVAFVIDAFARRIVGWKVSTSATVGFVLNALEQAIHARRPVLPPYSPDFNPIEKAFSKLKAMLRKASERTVSGLWDLIGRLVDLFQPSECANYFSSCGYDPD